VLPLARTLRLGPPCRWPGLGGTRRRTTSLRLPVRSPQHRARRSTACSGQGGEAPGGPFRGSLRGSAWLRPPVGRRIFGPLPKPWPPSGRRSCLVRGAGLRLLGPRSPGHGGSLWRRCRMMLRRIRRKLSSFNLHFMPILLLWRLPWLTARMRRLLPVYLLFELVMLLSAAPLRALWMRRRSLCLRLLLLLRRRPEAGSLLLQGLLKPHLVRWLLPRGTMVPTGWAPAAWLPSRPRPALAQRRPIWCSPGLSRSPRPRQPVRLGIAWLWPAPQEGASSCASAARPASRGLSLLVVLDTSRRASGAP